MYRTAGVVQNCVGHTYKITIAHFDGKQSMSANTKQNKKVRCRLFWALLACEWTRVVRQPRWHQFLLSGKAGEQWKKERKHRSYTKRKTSFIRSLKAWLNRTNCAKFCSFNESAKSLLVKQGFLTPWGPRSGSPVTTSGGLYYIALPWYCKTIVMRRGPQMLTVFGRGPQTMEDWEPLS